MTPYDELCEEVHRRLSSSMDQGNPLQSLLRLTNAVLAEWPPQKAQEARETLQREARERINIVKRLRGGES